VDVAKSHNEILIEPPVPAHAGQACCPPQSRHSLAAHLDIRSREFGVEARHTVGPARALMNRSHPQAQFRVRQGAQRR